MTLSQPIDHRSDTRHSRWFVAGNARARHALLDSQSLAPPILPPTAQLPSSPLPPHQSFAANQSPISLRAGLLHSLAAAKSP